MRVHNLSLSSCRRQPRQCHGLLSEHFWASMLSDDGRLVLLLTWRHAAFCMVGTIGGHGWIAGVCCLVALMASGLILGCLASVRSHTGSVII